MTSMTLPFIKILLLPIGWFNGTSFIKPNFKRLSKMYVVFDWLFLQSSMVDNNCTQCPVKGPTKCLHLQFGRRIWHRLLTLRDTLGLKVVDVNGVSAPSTPLTANQFLAIDEAS